MRSSAERPFVDHHGLTQKRWPRERFRRLPSIWPVNFRSPKREAPGAAGSSLSGMVDLP
jgi:hypothetical protein